MGLGNANAATIFYDNEADWLAAASTAGLSVSSFDTTAANVALANEVGVAPVGGTNMGSTLTFAGSNTGFGFDFEVTTARRARSGAYLLYRNGERWSFLARRSNWK
jgi:hypothetical protein